MPVYRPRTRLVNFRVNEEEYAALLAACSRNGARSVSDFARLAVMRQAGAGDKPAAAFQWRLSALGHKMAELESRVVQLLRLLEAAGSEAGNSPRNRVGVEG